MANGLFYIIEVLLLILVAIICGYLLIYACISIGQLARKNKILAAVGVYFGYSVVLQDNRNNFCRAYRDRRFRPHLQNNIGFYRNVSVRIDSYRTDFIYSFYRGDIFRVLSDNVLYNQKTFES